MNHRAVLAVAVALLVAACGGTSPSSPAPGGTDQREPVTGAVRDAAFALTLAVDRATFRAGEPITVGATYAYLGPRAAERVFHAASAIGFRIEEVGGARGMGGGMEMPCLFTDVAAGRPVAIPFAKAGSADAVFDLAWYRDPILRLPAGSWRIVADLDVYLGDCGGEHHPLQVAVGIVVEP